MDSIENPYKRTRVATHSDYVVYGFYLIFVLFLLSLTSSIAIILILGTTKIDLEIDFKEKPAPPGVELPGMGQLGSTATAIILIFMPLIFLTLLIFYSYLFDMKSYFQNKY